MKERIVVKKKDSVLIRIATEDDIRLHAYFLWENAGKIGNSEEYWCKAEQEIREKLFESVCS